MDNQSYEIVSVYHKHIDCDPNHDTWSRRNYHGLNLSYLHRFGLRNECDLIIDFQMWLNSFDVKLIYANDPRKERILLQRNYINDILLPVWRDRVNEPYHRVAVHFKELNVSILDTKCGGYIHNAYSIDPFTKMTESQKLKSLHGYHCSLYDSYELYLFYLFQTQCL